MRDALSADLYAIPGLEVLSFPDFEKGVNAADAVWMIAPESDGILERLTQSVENAGKQLLTSNSASVRLTSNKFQLFKHWKDAAVPTPATIPFREWQDNFYPAVMKPIDGCGSTATTYVSSPSIIEFARCRAKTAYYDVDRLIFQKYCRGSAASVAFLIGANSILPMLPAFQNVNADSHFAYHGGTIPIPHELAERAIALSKHAVESVPGLFGYVGVDLILGNQNNGSEDFVIEINPRLTTSYVGLRTLADFNIAKAVLDLQYWHGSVSCRWKPGRVNFTAEGAATVTIP